MFHTWVSLCYMPGATNPHSEYSEEESPRETVTLGPFDFLSLLHGTLFSQVFVRLTPSLHLSFCSHVTSL